MDRRREFRIEANEPAVITELGSQRHAAMGGMIQDLSGGGILIKLPRAIACNTPVRIETGTMLLLGEVVRCEPEGDEFRVAFALHHSLQNLQDLENLNRSLLGYDAADREKPDPEKKDGEVFVSVPVRERPL
jgi:hypothetical protein